MTLAPRLDLRQSQSLVMTPQLKQAIGLLQLSNLELEAVLMDAAAANPLLRVSGQEGEVEKKIDPKSEEPAEAGAPAAKVRSISRPNRSTAIEIPAISATSPHRARAAAASMAIFPILRPAAGRRCPNICTNSFTSCMARRSRCSSPARLSGGWTRRAI